MVDEIERHLAVRGVDVEEGSVVRHGGAGRGSSIYFRDPDGSLLEIIVYPGA
jgi:catechol 2,3-dioxygenase-like lactoylglutathione lyase family enzyme